MLEDSQLTCIYSECQRGVNQNGIEYFMVLAASIKTKMGEKSSEQLTPTSVVCMFVEQILKERLIKDSYKSKGRWYKMQHAFFRLTQ